MLLTPLPRHARRREGSCWGCGSAAGPCVGRQLPGLPLPPSHPHPIPIPIPELLQQSEPGHKAVLGGSESPRGSPCSPRCIPAGWGIEAGEGMVLLPQPAASAWG